MVELGKSKVPLEEDIIKKGPVEFVKTWLEWSSDKWELISRETSRTTGGTTTFFTVPENKTLYITSAWISGQGTSVGTVVNFRLNTSTSVGTLLRIFTNQLASQGYAIPYPLPVKLESGQTVSFSISIGQGTAGAGFHGFLIDKRIS